MNESQLQLGEGKARRGQRLTSGPPVVELVHPTRSAPPILFAPYMQQIPTGRGIRIGGSVSLIIGAKYIVRGEYLRVVGVAKLVSGVGRLAVYAPIYDKERGREIGGDKVFEGGQN